MPFNNKLYFVPIAGGPVDACYSDIDISNFPLSIPSSPNSFFCLLRKGSVDSFRENFRTINQFSMSWFSFLFGIYVEDKVQFCDLLGLSLSIKCDVVLSGLKPSYSQHHF